MNDDRTRLAIRGSAVGIGTELNQTYCIDSLLGVGGMGEVFKGHNIQTGDPVAIKIVLPEFAQDETILNLFRKEARILNHLNHEAIVRYYVFSIDAKLARPYLAMEFVDGPSLAAHVKTTPIAASDFMPLLRRLADGLHRAHIAGVIHRDMSPDNVILPDGLVQNAKIIDFGIARTATVGGGTLLGGGFAGKYSYVSPEQLGLFGGEITPKSDMYGLALVMAAAIRGHPLDMSGSQVDIIEKRRTVPELKGIPAQFHPLLSAMLAPDPNARPADMAAVRDWVGVDAPVKSRPEQPKKATPVKPAEPAPPRGSNAMRNMALAAAVVAVAAAGSIGGWIFVQKDVAPSAGSGGEIAEPATPDNGSAADAGPSTPARSDNTPPTQIEPDTDAPDTTPPSVIAATPAPPSTAVLPVAPPGDDTAPPTAASVASETVTPQEPSPPVSTPPARQEVALAPGNVIPAPAPPAAPALLSGPPLQDFVDGFGSDHCFAATGSTLTASSADITGLGTVDASQAFTDAFKQKAGFTPVVSLDPVSAPQCGFVQALRNMSVANAAPLNIAVNKTQIRGGDADAGIVGDPLKVTVTGAGDRNIYLFVMDHNGGIQNINRLCASCITMKAGGLDADLSLSAPAKVDGEIEPPFYPMLVFAVASPKPLLTINAQDAFDASDFIEPFLGETAKARDVSTAVSFVRLVVN